VISASVPGKAEQDVRLVGLQTLSPEVDVLYFFSPGLGTGVQPGPFGGGTGLHPGPSGFGTGFHPGSSGFGSGVDFLFGGTGSFDAPTCGFGFSSLPICASSCLGVTIRSRRVRILSAMVPFVALFVHRKTAIPLYITIIFAPSKQLLAH